jgi:hypothetical protein
VSNFISLERAIEMTSLYRQQLDTILADEYKGQGILVKSEVFSKEQVEKLLTKPECNQLRIYYGMSQDLKIHALLVGVDEHGADILNGNPSNNEEEDVLEEAKRCPPYCPVPSPLNS